MFDYDGHAGCASVASDGSARCSLLPYCYFDRSANREVYVHELQRVHSVTQEVIADYGFSDTGSLVPIQHHIGLVTSVMDRDNLTHTDLHIVNNSAIPSPTIALHSIDTVVLTNLQTKKLSNTCLFAYGGSAGVVRIHSRNLKKDLI